MVPVTSPSRNALTMRRSRAVARISGAVPIQARVDRLQSGNANTSRRPDRTASQRLLMNGGEDLWYGRTFDRRSLAANMSSRESSGGTASRYWGAMGERPEALRVFSTSLPPGILLVLQSLV